jgi:hypothetical protein
MALGAFSIISSLFKAWGWARVGGMASFICSKWSASWWEGRREIRSSPTCQRPWRTTFYTGLREVRDRIASFCFCRLSARTRPGVWIIIITIRASSLDSVIRHVFS